jgi:hypothetical protein
MRLIGFSNKAATAKVQPSVWQGEIFGILTWCFCDKWSVMKIPADSY